MLFTQAKDSRDERSASDREMDSAPTSLLYIDIRAATDYYELGDISSCTITEV